MAEFQKSSGVKKYGIYFDSHGHHSESSKFFKQGTRDGARENNHVMKQQFEQMTSECFNKICIINICFKLSHALLDFTVKAK